MSAQLALLVVGAAITVLVMMMVVVSIARRMDGSVRPRTKPGLAEVKRVFTRLAEARRGDKAAAADVKALAKGGAKAGARSMSRGMAAFAAAVAVSGGVAAFVDKHARADEPPVASEITAGPLHGTLLATAKPKRVVLIVPGSGPTDRDGNSPLGVKANSYRLLAEGLAEKDIASVRVDKRGMFGSREAGDPNAASIAVYATDIRAWIDTTRAATHVKCVWLLGHSEGALMVSAAAEGRRDVCGLILVSGAGRRLGDVLREQLKANPANAPVLDQAMAALAELEAGRHVDASKLHPGLQGLFNAPAQDFLISEIGVDPVDLVRKAKKKTLIVQGTHDIQVSVADGKLLDKAPKTRLKLIEGMNHVLKLAPADRAGNIATYSNPDLPLAPKLVDEIARFVKGDDD